MEPPVTRVRWSKYFRLVNSRYPPIDLFEDIADPEDWWILGVAESKTNPRVAKSVGNIDMIPKDRLVGGPNSTWVMAPFAHAAVDNPGRFHTGNYGAFYAARRFETALFETIYHQENFCRSTNEIAGWISQMRELVGSVDAKLHDLRTGSYKRELSPSSYRSSQKMATSLKESGSNGIVFPSVRHEGGECLATFYPDVVRVPKEVRHLSYHWDGERINQIKFTSGDREVYHVDP